MRGHQLRVDVVRTGARPVSVASALPAFAAGLCDDAAVFPPGRKPLADAVPDHARHRASAYAELVGPLVLAVPSLDRLAPLLDGQPRLALSVTAPDGPEQAAAAVATAAELPVDVTALEIAVPPGLDAREVVAAVRRVRAGAGDVTVYVEVPRDERRADVITACAEAGARAKFRTGGVRAELYPGEAELAAAIVAVVKAGVPYKATAGLHHAIRNTDPETGFEQHGFLNLLLATDAALRGEEHDAVAGILADRDGAAVAARVRELGDERAAQVRSRFISFGTCSITEPLDELVELGLLPASLVSGEGVKA